MTGEPWQEPVAALPETTGENGSAISTGAKPRRTEFIGAFVSVAEAFPNIVFGVIAASIGLGDKPWGIAVIAAIALAGMGIGMLASYTGWRRRTYTVGDTDIRVESGILSRSARSVPYERIQDVGLEQKFLPRLFGLVAVSFDTGAGGKDDLKLAYLREEEGERLRELVRARKEDGQGASLAGLNNSRESGSSQVHGGETAHELFAMSPRRIVTFGLFEFSLAVVAVVAGVAQQFEPFLPFDLWNLDWWQQQLSGPGQWLAGLGPLAQVIGALMALASLALVGFVSGLLRTVLRYWDFRLERTAKGLRRRRGLLTRTDTVMPIHRVQALRYTTGIVRRVFGWHGLKVISLAQDSASASHAVAPFAKWDELRPVARATRFVPPDETLDWRRASARYRFDKAALSFLVFVPLSIGAIMLSEILGLRWLPLILSGILLLALMLALQPFFLWRFERHAIDAAQLYARSGWLAPNTTIANRVKLQSVEIRQGPIARLRGYATVHLGLAGGRLVLRGLPVARARQLRGDVLASIGATDFSAVAEG